MQMLDTNTVRSQLREAIQATALEANIGLLLRAVLTPHDGKLVKPAALARKAHTHAVEHMPHLKVAQVRGAGSKEGMSLSFHMYDMSYILDVPLSFNADKTLNVANTLRADGSERKLEFYRAALAQVAYNVKRHNDLVQAVNAHMARVCIPQGQAEPDDLMASIFGYELPEPDPAADVKPEAGEAKAE